MDILNRIQAKDSAAKAQIALMSAGVVTGIIALIWISTLPARIGNTISLDGKNHAGEESKSGLSSIFGDAKNQLGSLSAWKDQLKAAEETAAPQDSALGALSSELQASSSIAESLPPTTPEEIPPTSALSEVTATPSVATATPEAAPSQEPVPPPKVILIGTSTAQKPQ